MAATFMRNPVRHAIMALLAYWVMGICVPTWKGGGEDRESGPPPE